MSEYRLRNFWILLSFFHKMFSITQRCDNMVAIPHKVTKLGTALMVHIKEAFPFAVISPSVHQMAAHSGQLFELTEGQSIAIYAENSSGKLGISSFELTNPALQHELAIAPSK